jgi:hypothetical protein
VIAYINGDGDARERYVKEYRPGDVITESRDVVHWAENKSGENDPRTDDYRSRYESNSRV